MLYNAQDIANYIISYCYDKNESISNLKLQKVLYFTWVEYYKKMLNPLFLDNICAWQFGPVVPDVYYEYCSHGGRPICFSCESDITEVDKNVLNEILDAYIHIPASELVCRTHQPETAWDIIFRNGSGNRDVIPFSLIKERECVR